jgi:hypothetical protein
LKAAVRCVAPRFLWSSVVGAYGNETGRDDAFSAILETLQRRKVQTHG